VRRPYKWCSRDRRAGQMVGYLRVSALDQKELRQLDRITRSRSVSPTRLREGHAPVPTSITSGVRARRRYCCVYAMDRLARNPDDLRKIVLGLTERGDQVRFERENLTFTGEDSPMSHLLLSVMGALARFERDLIRERQRGGNRSGETEGGCVRWEKALAHAFASYRPLPPCKSR
jgi:DNA invertase Pin-like site-specific DNA recombinase